MEVHDYICVVINGAYEYLTKMDILMFLNNKTNVLYSKYSKNKALELSPKEDIALKKELKVFLEKDGSFNNQNIHTVIKINTKE